MFQKPSLDTSQKGYETVEQDSSLLARISGKEWDRQVLQRDAQICLFQTKSWQIKISTLHLLFTKILHLLSLERSKRWRHVYIHCLFHCLWSHAYWRNGDGLVENEVLLAKKLVVDWCVDKVVWWSVGGRKTCMVRWLCKVKIWSEDVLEDWCCEDWRLVKKIKQRKIVVFILLQGIYTFTGYLYFYSSLDNSEILLCQAGRNIAKARQDRKSVV